jgi:hypothetical protein
MTWDEGDGVIAALRRGRAVEVSNSMYGLRCERCGTTETVQLADSVSATRAPWMRQGILDRTFHRFPCASCATVKIVEKELLYTDFDRGQWIGMFPVQDLPRHEECGRLVLETFHEAMVEKAPAVLSQWAPSLRVRVTFGYEELREKIVCWEADLDDGILEILRLQLLWEQPELIARGVIGFTLEFATDQWLMLLPIRRDRALIPEMRGSLVPRSAYRVLAEDEGTAVAEQARYWTERPYVSLLGLMPMVARQPGTPRSSAERRIWRESRR